MMSIDDRSTRGGSKGVRKKEASKCTDRITRQGDARSVKSNNHRSSRSGGRRRSATRSRSASASWDDGEVGAWATSRSHRPARSGDVMWDEVIGDDPIDWDRQSYPPLDQTQNLNAVAQKRGGMNVSEYGTNSSSSSVFSGSSSVSRYSSPERSEDSWP